MVTVEKSQVGKAMQAASAVIITTPEELTKATDVLGRIKKLAKIIEEKKKAITSPMNEALKAARALFAPMESDLETAERLIKGKMVAYDTKARAEEAAARAKVADKVETGKMKFETAEKKMAAIPVTETKVEGNTGAAVTFKIRKVAVVTDKLALIKAVSDGGIVTELLEVSNKVLQDLVVKQGVAIAGVTVEERKEVAGSTG